MNTKAELKKFSEFVTTIKSITRVYEQAAARKMKGVRIEIDKITEYLENARETYSSTKVSLASEESRRMREGILKTSFRHPNKKQVLVLISSQNHYYGQLILNMFKLFLEEYKRSGSDGIILGNIGREFFRNENISAGNVTFFDFDDVVPDWNVIHKVSDIVGNYEKIIVFYGQYKSVLTQEPNRGDLSQNIIVVNEAGKVKKYLFRPEPAHSLSFLEKQMIAGDFLQKIYESQVAKYAARIKILEIGQVAEKISQALDQLGRDRSKVRKTTNNKKQQQLFCGSNLWQKSTTELV